MGKRALLSTLAVSMLLLFAAPAHARYVEAEGSAKIANGAIGAARELAVKDAIRQAMVQSNVQVATATLISSNVLVADSAQFRSNGKVEDVVVLSEWVEDDQLHVRIRANILTDKDKPKIPASRYRKKVAALQFHIQDRRQTFDLPGIEMEWPREVMRILENTGTVLAVDGTRYNLQHFIRTGASASSTTFNESVGKIAERLGVQFLIYGVIRDTSVDQGMFQSKRNLELDIFLYDGVTGALLARHRLSESVAHAGYFRNPSAIASEEFTRTEFGQAFKRVLLKQVAMINDDLEQMPFVARVLRTEGNRIYFDAGATSQVQVGDTLMGYRLADEALYDKDKIKFFGYPEQPVATLTVKMVQPLFAVGLLEGEEVYLREGDVIRFGW